MVWLVPVCPGAVGAEQPMSRWHQAQTMTSRE